MNCPDSIKEEDKNSATEESQRSLSGRVTVEKMDNNNSNNINHSWCSEEPRSLNSSIQSTCTLLDGDDPSFSEAQLRVEEPDMWPSDHSHLTLELASFDLGDTENPTPGSPTSTPSPIESSKPFPTDRMDKESISSTNQLFRDDLSLTVNLESKEVRHDFRAITTRGLMYKSKKDNVLVTDAT